MNNILPILLCLTCMGGTDGGCNNTTLALCLVLLLSDGCGNGNNGCSL